MSSADPWGSRCAADRFVDTDHARGQLTTHLAGELFFSKDHGTKSVLGVVCKLHRFVGAADGLHADDRAEGFDDHDVHIVVAVVEECWSDEVALHRLVTHDDFRALIDRVFDLSEDMFFLFAHNHRSDACGLVVTVRDFELGDLCFEFVDELILDGVLDIDPFGGDTDLSAVAERVADAVLRGFVEVRAFEDDQRVFGTEFEDESFESLGGGGHDVLASVFGAGECDHVDIAGDECFALVVFAVDDLEDAFGEELVEDFDILVSDERGLL